MKKILFLALLIGCDTPSSKGKPSKSIKNGGETSTLAQSRQGFSASTVEVRPTVEATPAVEVPPLVQVPHVLKSPAVVEVSHCESTISKLKLSTHTAFKPVQSRQGFSFRAGEVPPAVEVPLMVSQINSGPKNEIIDPNAELTIFNCELEKAIEFNCELEKAIENMAKIMHKKKEKNPSFDITERNSMDIKLLELGIFIKYCNGIYYAENNPDLCEIEQRNQAVERKEAKILLDMINYTAKTNLSGIQERICNLGLKVKLEEGSKLDELSADRAVEAPPALKEYEEVLELEELSADRVVFSPSVESKSATSTDTFKPSKHAVCKPVKVSFLNNLFNKLIYKDSLFDEFVYKQELCLNRYEPAPFLKKREELNAEYLEKKVQFKAAYKKLSGISKYLSKSEAHVKRLIQDKVNDIFENIERDPFFVPRIKDMVIIHQLIGKFSGIVTDQLQLNPFLEAVSSYLNSLKKLKEALDNDCDTRWMKQFCPNVLKKHELESRSILHNLFCDLQMRKKEICEKRKINPTKFLLDLRAYYAKKKATSNIEERLNNLNEERKKIIKEVEIAKILEERLKHLEEKRDKIKGEIKKIVEKKLEDERQKFIEQEKIVRNSEKRFDDLEKEIEIVEKKLEDENKSFIRQTLMEKISKEIFKHF